LTSLHCLALLLLALPPLLQPHCLEAYLKPQPLVLLLLYCQALPPAL
jgi:hypothetical protein